MTDSIAPEIASSKTFAYAKILHDGDFPYNGHNYAINLNSIRTICGIPVGIIINASTKMLYIHHHQIYQTQMQRATIELYSTPLELNSPLYDRHANVPWTPIQIYDYIVGTIKHIEGLKFDKASGRFIQTLDRNGNIVEATLAALELEYVAENLSIQTNIELQNPLCAVCLELTSTKTCCGHSICIPCWTGVLATTKVCPLCRGQLKYQSENLHNEEGYYSDDDDATDNDADETDE